MSFPTDVLPLASSRDGWFIVAVHQQPSGEFVFEEKRLIGEEFRFGEWTTSRGMVFRHVQSRSNMATILGIYI